MNTFLLSCRAISCVTLALAFSSCADHSTASNHTRPRSGAVGGSPSGAIPTGDSTRHSTYVAGNAAGGGNGDEYSVPTGSQIPRHYHRVGYTTDAPDPVFVYDDNDIRAQSTDTVSDQLRTVPGVNVRGGR